MSQNTQRAVCSKVRVNCPVSAFLLFIYSFLTSSSLWWTLSLPFLFKVTFQPINIWLTDSTVAVKLHTVCFFSMFVWPPHWPNSCNLLFLCSQRATQGIWIVANFKEDHKVFWVYGLCSVVGHQISCSNLLIIINMNYCQGKAGGSNHLFLFTCMYPYPTQ